GNYRANIHVEDRQNEIELYVKSRYVAAGALHRKANLGKILTWKAVRLQIRTTFQISPRENTWVISWLQPRFCNFRLGSHSAGHCVGWQMGHLMRC
ncbi:hypothetical protein E4U11_007065, partial [Claviceps purpurea]